MTTAKTVYNNGATNEIYYFTGQKWYNLVKAETMGLVQAAEAAPSNINGNGLYTYWNMQ
ncbi:hypothetical protein [Syntrophomonas palmitatica]|uniref:hypothetical protein n=1 Tax=Syntrophomonas palmitatica TaxID=402877 RepID=UPI000AB4DFF9|nr:hypothetical protein [Syntrophomonas palmitatica]